MLCLKLGICTLVLRDNDLTEAAKEHTVYAEKLTVTAGTADNSTKNVAASLVGGDNAVGDHKGSRSYVVGNNTDRNVVIMLGTVGLACDLTNAVKKGTNGINLKEVADTLHYAGKTLKSHTRIDILLSELGIIALAVVVELGEYVVPDLHKSVTVTAGLTVGAAAAELLAAVKVDLRAGAAGT